LGGLDRKWRSSDFSLILSWDLAAVNIQRRSKKVGSGTKFKRITSRVPKEKPEDTEKSAQDPRGGVGSLMAQARWRPWSVTGNEL